MTLTLSMLRCPDAVAPETHSVAGGEFSLGRGPENDWVLPDPERCLSKRHCIVAFRNGSWQVADLSTNGTFLNREGAPIGRGEVRELRDGDRLSFGAYEIEVRIAAAASAVRPRRDDPAAARLAPPPELFALDPVAAPGRNSARAADPLLGGAAADDPFAAGLGRLGISLPADFDPLAPDPVEREFRGPTQPDHNPHIEDAFTPPPVRPVLPDDWDRDLAAATAPGAKAPAAAPDIAPSPAPVPPPTAPRVAAAGQQPAAVTGPDLLTAFLDGAGLGEWRPADPAATMSALGAAFRAVVAGLRQAMIARAAVKGEFRIEQTMIRARGNNPLKFSADDEDALAALLGAGRHSEMPAAEAVTDALRDMRLHELAMMAAMQTAVRALLAEFEPTRVRQAAERGGLSLVPRQRKADAWDAFETLYNRTAQALTDDFDSVFGKAFARAYERALADISVREPAA